MVKICDLASIDAKDLRHVGGKAIGLARLIRGGFSVPPGFCVTVSAFETESDPNATVRTNERLGGSVALPNEHLGPEISSLVGDWYRRLGGGKVAVRSSATLEDGAQASFAGQQQTFLGVESAATVCDSVVQCWESQFAAGAAAYRQHHGIEESTSAMAVIVQRMVDADVAGVVFTRDPVEPKSERMIVEASWGLGESVVSGRVTPDSWVLDRHDGTSCKRQIANKKFQMKLDGPSDVPPDRREQPSLTDEQLKRLAEIARQVEEELEVPCDIEWALSNNQFWLLQARPITTADRVDQDELVFNEVAVLRSIAESSGTAWVRQNLAEVLPAPTPLTWSVIRKLMCGKGGFGLVYSDLGFSLDPSLEHDGVFDLVFGRPYCNLSREPKLYSGVLPLEHPYAALKAHPEKAFSSAPVLNAHPMDAKMWFRLGVAIPGMIVRSIVAAFRRRIQRHSFEKRFLENIVPPFERDAIAAINEDLTGLDSGKIWELCESWQQRTLVDFARESLKPTSLASLASKRIELLLAPCLGPERAGIASREFLMHVAPHSVSNLSQAVGDYAAGTLTRDEFLSRFGHRGGNEMELSTPRWSEQPMRVDGFGDWSNGGSAWTNPLTPTLSPQSRGEGARIEQRADDATILFPLSDAEEEPLTPTPGAPGRRRLSPQSRGEGGADWRASNSDSSQTDTEFVEQTLAKVIQESKLSKGLANRLRRDVLEMRAMVRLRETGKHFFMMGYAVVRKLLCELDRRFQLDGGIFFLTVVEIPALLTSGVPSPIGEKKSNEMESPHPVPLPATLPARRDEDTWRGGQQSILKLIASRKAKRRDLLRIDVPAVIFSDELDQIGRASKLTATSTFQGTPISTGIAEAPALVLEYPDEDPGGDGFVLICPSTDPAWVPLFTRAKALVMESGGVLSHGAIVAREFGLPAVAGLPGIVRQIKTGQRVRVDGNAGLVAVLNDQIDDGRFGDTP